jgi:hypothetical protein
MGRKNGNVEKSKVISVLIWDVQILNRAEDSTGISTTIINVVRNQEEVVVSVFVGYFVITAILL